jgi:hypothetical protein
MPPRVGGNKVHAHVVVSAVEVAAAADNDRHIRGFVEILRAAVNILDGGSPNEAIADLIIDARAEPQPSLVGNGGVTTLEFFW